MIGHILCFRSPRSDTLFNYFSPDTDWTDETWHGRTAQFYEILWQEMQLYTLRDANVVIDYLGHVLPDGTWVDTSNQRQALDALLWKWRQQAEFIRDDLQMIVLSSEFGTGKADKQIVNDWMATDRLIEKAISALQSTIYSQLAIVEAVRE